VAAFAVGNVDDQPRRRFARRQTSHTDAAGMTTVTTYDVQDRPVTINDGTATQTFTYDRARGLLALVADPQAAHSAPHRTPTLAFAREAAGWLTDWVWRPDGCVAEGRLTAVQRESAAIRASKCHGAGRLLPADGYLTLRVGRRGW
jgi:YD repeat-containing protein